MFINQIEFDTSSYKCAFYKNKVVQFDLVFKMFVAQREFLLFIIYLVELEVHLYIRAVIIYYAIGNHVNFIVKLYY